MPTYTALVALDVPHYGAAEIDAETPEAALAAARKLNILEIVDDPGWENAFCPRIVNIEDPDGQTVAEDVMLDGNALVIVGYPDKIRIAAAATDLLEALQDLLGDRPAVQGGICQLCGRDYMGDIETGNGEATQANCPSDDCPHTKARAAIAKATEDRDNG
jgi:hypothetical protein